MASTLRRALVLPANTCPKAVPGSPRLYPALYPKGRDTAAPMSPRRSTGPAGPAALAQRGRKPRLTPASASRGPAASPGTAEGTQSNCPGPALPQPPRPPRRAWPLPLALAHLELPQQPQEGQQPRRTARRHRPPAARPRPRLLLLPALRQPGTRPQRVRALVCGESCHWWNRVPKALAPRGSSTTKKERHGLRLQPAKQQEAGLLTGMSAAE